MPDTQPFSRNRLNILLIINATALAYLVALLAGFSTLDDMSMMRDLQNGKLSLSALLNPGGAYFRPLTMLSYMADYSVWGANPSEFHAINIILHTANACLVYLLCRAYMGGEIREQAAALAGALFFALTPLNSEAVIWVSARPDLLCGLFFLAALLVVAQKELSNTRGAILFGLMFLLSLSAKESSLALVLIVPLWLFLSKRSRCDSGRAWSMTGAAVLIVLFYFFWRSNGGNSLDQGVVKVTGRVAGSDPLNILRDGSAAIGFYVRKMIWPFPLNLGQKSIDTRFYAPLGLGVVTIFAGLFISAHRLRLPLLIIMGCLGMPLLAMYGNIPWTPFAERYLYLSMTGVALLTGLAIVRMPRLPLIIPFALILLMGVASVNRAGLWASPVSLWQETVRLSPGLAAAKVIYAFELLEIDRPDEARRNLDLAAGMGFDKELLWRCRARIYLIERNFGLYKEAMLKVAARSSDPGMIHAEMMKTLVSEKLPVSQR